MAQNLSYLWHSTFESGAVQLCPITEIAPESAFVWSCRWYCFRVDARVNRYGVYLAKIKCARVTGFPPFSRAYRVLVRLNFPSPWKGPAPQLRSQGPLLLVSRTLGTRLTYHPSPGYEVRSTLLTKSEQRWTPRVKPNFCAYKWRWAYVLQSSIIFSNFTRFSCLYCLFYLYHNCICILLHFLRDHFKYLGNYQYGPVVWEESA